MLMFKLLGHIYDLITVRYVFIYNSLCRIVSEKRTTEICKIILGLSYTSLWNIRTKIFDEIYIYILYINEWQYSRGNINSQVDHQK